MFIFEVIRNLKLIKVLTPWYKANKRLRSGKDLIQK